MTPRILEVETTWNTFLLIGAELISNECFFGGAGGDGAVWRQVRMRFGNVEFEDRGLCTWKWLNHWKYRHGTQVRYEDRFEIIDIVMTSIN